MDRIQLENLASTFLSQLFEDLEKCQVDVFPFVLDHICWRCATQEDFQQMEAKLLAYGKLFHKNIHNGREISLIKLNKPIVHHNREISLLELPAPKSDKTYPNGFEHAEFVVPESLSDWHQQYPLDWITKNIDKKINPDVKLRFDNISVKFHPYSLAHVVKHLE